MFSIIAAVISLHLCPVESPPKHIYICESVEVRKAVIEGVNVDIAFCKLWTVERNPLYTKWVACVNKFGVEL